MTGTSPVMTDGGGACGEGNSGAAGDVSTQTPRPPHFVRSLLPAIAGRDEGDVCSHQSTEAALRFVRHSIGAAIALAVASTSIPLPAHAQLASLNFKGFNYVSYYNGGYVNADSMPALVTTGANAVALAFEYGIDVDNSTVYADSGYTDSSSVIASTIAEANSHGLNVMVRPLIDFLDQSKIGTYSVGDWRSTYNPTNAATFFASYKSMIVSVAQLAQANGAASLSIGVELDQLTGPAYQSYWTDIITAVRAVFSG